MSGQGQLDPMVWEADPNSIKVHPLANLLPMMSPSELADLKHSVEFEGQQHAGVMFEGKLLDGRNRRLVCLEVGVPFRAQNFLGTRDQALLHVVSSNRCRRDLNKSQLAAVGSRLLPRLSPEIQAERVRKTSEARRKAGQSEIWELVPGSDETTANEVRARVVAADMVGVSDRYVADAARLEREAPELFEEVWLGKTTVKAAMRELLETAESAIHGRVRSTRSRFAGWMRRVEAEERTDVLDAFDELMDRLDAAGQDTAAAP